MNENDLRVQRTRRLLGEALIALMAERDYEAISIGDITQTAQVGYRTFFRHYESKDALLQAVIDDIMARFRRMRVLPDIAGSSEQNTIAAFHFAEEHADLFRLLLQTRAAEVLIATVSDFAMEEGENFFSGSDLPDELVTYHFASSIVNFLRWWLLNNMPFPAEEMAVYVNHLLIRPINALSTGNDGRPTCSDS